MINWEKQPSCEKVSEKVFNKQGPATEKINLDTEIKSDQVLSNQETIDRDVFWLVISFRWIGLKLSQLEPKFEAFSLEHLRRHLELWSTNSANRDI